MPAKSRKRRINIVTALISTVVTILLFERALWLLDPWGMHYFDDLSLIWENIQSSTNRITILVPGTYHFSHWSATELPGGIRRIPANQSGPCKVVFIGDSVTWGHGVNDEETWVNLLAGQLPGATVINAAQDGYNSENVRGTLADFPDAHLFVYLIIGNDAEPTTDANFRLPRTGMIPKYLSYIRVAGYEGSNQAHPQDTSRFDEDIGALRRDPRVVIAGFGGQLLTERARATAIPMYTRWISKVDPHPNAEGNRQVATAMLPIVQQAMADKCRPIF